MISAKLADIIITEAKSMGIYNGFMPETDEERIKDAEQLVKDAKYAWEKKNVRGKGVRAILALVPGDEKESVEPLPVEADPEPTPKPARATMDEAQEQRAYALAQVRKEGLPEPPDFQSDPPVLPRDITVLSDRGLRELQSVMLALYARTNWLVSNESIDEISSGRVASHYFNKRIQKLDKVDPDTNKSKLVSVLESEASEDPDVLKWRSKETDHRNAAKTFKSLRDNYLKSLDVISREYTMRENERNHG